MKLLCNNAAARCFRNARVVLTNVSSSNPMKQILHLPFGKIFSEAKIVYFLLDKIVTWIGFFFMKYLLFLCSVLKIWATLIVLLLNLNNFRNKTFLHHPTTSCFLEHFLLALSWLKTVKRPDISRLASLCALRNYPTATRLSCGM